MPKRLWPSKIKYQLVLGVTLIHLLIMTILVLDLIIRQKRFIEQQNIENASNLVDNLAANAQPFVIAYDFDGLDKLVKSYNSYQNLKYTMILSPEGTVLGHTDNQYIGKTVQDSISKQLNKVTNKITLLKNNTVVDIAAPIYHNKLLLGWVRIGLGQEHVYDNIKSIIRDGIVYIIVALIIGALLAFIIAKRLTEGLYKLIHTANSIKAGDRDIRVSILSNEELTQLGTAFNQMLDEINANEKILNMVLDNMPVGVWILNAKGDIISANNAAKEIWGGAKFVNISQYDIYKGWFVDTGNPVKAHQWGGALAIKKGETTSNKEVEIESFDGVHKFILHSALPLLDNNKNIAGAVEIDVDITDRKRTESILRKVYHDIGERVKELRCLYQLSQYSNNTNMSMEEILQASVEVIPPSYQYPNITCAKIVFNKKKYFSSNFRETVWKQEAAIISAGIEVGKVEVFYKEKKQDEQEGPFLREERLMINSIAELLGNTYERKKAALEILRLNRLYQFLSQINDAMLKVESPHSVYSEACRIAVEYGKCSMAWIGVHDKETDVITPLNWRGNEDGYLQTISISAQDTTTGQGPTGRAIREKKYQFCNDIANDPKMLPWKDEALKRNYQSSISIPIIVNSQVDAIYTLYMPEQFFFNDVEIKLLQEVADNMAFALDKIKLRELQTKSETELRLSEEKFRSLVEQSLVGVYILQNEKFVYVNPGFEKMSGYSKEELMREITFDKLVYQDDLTTVKAHYEERMSGKSTDNQYVFRAIRKDGTLLHVEAIVSTIMYNSNTAIIGTIVDITESIREEMRINKAVADAQEKERMQIGMELHDNVQQIMVASLLGLELVKKKIDDTATATELITNVKTDISEAINELRQLSHLLAPSMNPLDSFERKVQNLINTINSSNRYKISLNIQNSQPPIHKDIQLAFYRIIQEQLSNILKHAEATAILIEVTVSQNKVQLKIQDDGKGFNVQMNKTGIGMENIKRRAGVLGGTVSVSSTPGSGCEITVLIPIFQEV